MNSETFPTPAEQLGAIAETFKEAEVVIISAFARPFASATVEADGEKYDVDVYRDSAGRVRTGDVFNTRFDTGE